jgi:hypothetical protein
MTDNCPNCCHGPNEPNTSSNDGIQLTDTYRCGSCGHAWTTCRNAAAYEGFDPSQYPAPTAARQPHRITTQYPVTDTAA